MPSANDADSPDRILPPDLQQDYRAFRAELARVADRADPAASVRDLLEDGHALERMARFALLLYEQSARLALLARSDRSRIFTRHILDSLNPLSLFDRPPKSMLDVGSGAGLPGIPLAIAWPHTRITLLESREKKAGFLERAAREIDGDNVSVICARLEEAGTASWRAGPFEAITIRAVGDLRQLLQSASCTAAPGATWIYFLGDAVRAETVMASLGAAALEPAVRQGALGGWLLTGRFAKRGS